MSEAKDIFSGIGQSMNGLGGIHSLGILNALKTGDPHIDMIVALCFPFLLTYMLGCLKEFKKYFNKEFWWGWWYGDMAPTVYHERTISHTTHTDAYGDTSSADATSHNSVIIKAIRLYCHAMIDLKLQKADLSLTAMEDELHSGTQNSYYGQSIVNLLKQYKLVKNPPEKQWHQLGVFGEKKHNESLVEMTRTSNDSNDSEEENKSASKRTERTTYTFRSLDGHAIDTFLGTAYKWYLEQLKQKEDISRYYYDLEPTTGESNSPRYYKRFRLSEDKTFESLFFREKKPIMKLVDDFMQKRGRYGIKGYPYKLGLLLHGPPGTGKTSLIKALAQHTGRSIVNVPLSKISTNAELMSQLFDKKYRVPGELTVSLDFKDVIFCLEDLDAASDIVRRRDGKSDDGDELIPIDEIPPTKSLWHYFLESSSEACQELVKVLKDKSDKLKQEAQKPDCVAACLDCLTGVRPGLALATSKNSAVRKLGEDAIKAASDKVCTTGKIDAFLEHQAKKMKRMLDNGVVVDASFVESLLSTDPVSLSSLGASSMTNSSTSDFTDTSSTEESYSYERRPMPPPPTDSGDGNKPSSDSNTKTPYSSSWFRTPDALDLAGLLNALDGVVDCPGRIVVMTSNHPEKLDKALIRPGRIDKKLYLGKMKGLDVMEMLEHYFETELSEVQRQRVESTISDGATEFSPAEIEQMTAECDDVEGLIAALEEKALAGVGLVPGSP